MQIHQFEDKGLSQYAYLIADEQSKEAVIIDPQRIIAPYQEYIRAHGYILKYVLETHIHADYISGAETLAGANGARLMLSGHTEGEKYVYDFEHQKAMNGDKIQIGQVSIQILHTPGHTPEHLSFVAKDGTQEALFSGDFLFLGSVGRPDLIGEEAKQKLAAQLYDSIHNVLIPLGDAVVIYPGHGAGSLCGAGMSKASSSTLGEERKSNPYLSPSMSREEFVKKLLSKAPPMPGYYQRMKEINSEGAEPVDLSQPVRAMSPEEFAEEAFLRGTVIDVRHSLAFGGGHLPESLNFHFGDKLSFWAAYTVPYDSPLYIMTDEPEKVEEIRRQLANVGLDEVEGYLKGGMDAWIATGEDFEDIPQVSVRFLDDMLDAKERMTVLDVRSEAEFAEGHIKGARHVYLGDLKEKAEKLFKDKDEPIACICGGGARSSLATSILTAVGYEMVYNISGGMSAWKRAGFPVSTKELASQKV